MASPVPQSALPRRSPRRAEWTCPTFLQSFVFSIATHGRAAARFSPLPAAQPWVNIPFIRTCAGAVCTRSAIRRSARSFDSIRHSDLSRYGVRENVTCRTSLTHPLSHITCHAGNIAYVPEPLADCLGAARGRSAARKTPDKPNRRARHALFFPGEPHEKNFTRSESRSLEADDKDFFDPKPHSGELSNPEDWRRTSAPMRRSIPDLLVEKSFGIATAGLVCYPWAISVPG